jgi:hypothetical protein
MRMHARKGTVSRNPLTVPESGQRCWARARATRTTIANPRRTTPPGYRAPRTPASRA